MQPQFKRLGRRLNEIDVEQFEKAIRHSLPMDYRAFLLSTNGAVPDPRFIRAERSSQRWSINVFFGLTRDIESSNLGNVLDDLRETLPLGYLPVAGTDTGEFVLLGLEARGGGPVVLWQWQEDSAPGVHPHLYTLARDFSSFLRAFHDLRA